MAKEKIYLLPGLMNNEMLWTKLVPLLKKNFELVHIPIPLGKDFDESSLILDSFFKEGKVNLLGFSLGAYLASYYSVKNKNRVKRLFLVGGTPSSLSPIEDKRRELTLNQMNNLNFKKLSTKSIRVLLEKNNQNDTSILELIQEMFSSFSLNEYKLQLSSTFKRIDLYDEMFKLDIPINFLYSKKDKLLNHISLEKIKKEHTHIIQEKLEGTSHMIPLEYPQILAKSIINWMKR